MPVKCAKCDGKGNDGYHKTEPCSACDGTGRVGDPIVVPKASKRGKND